jgi:hypothetical protein
LILPALHATSWKIYDEEPQQGDDENPRTPTKNCQISDANIFLFAARGAVPGTQRVSYSRTAFAVKGLPRP